MWRLSHAVFCIQELNKAMDKMNALDAWELEGRAKDVLALLGLSDPNMKIEAMSGGQARKVAVASALLGTPEVLILDEPTNHMDVQVCLMTFATVSAYSDVRGLYSMWSEGSTRPLQKH